MTQETLSTPAEATPTATGRVALLTFTKVPSDRVKLYVAFLLSRGVPVTLVCLDQDNWQEFRGVGHLDIVPLGRAEERRFVNVVESAVIRAVDRAHNKVAEAFHTKVYNRFYAVVRAQILSSVGRRELHKNGPIPPLARIIAADTNAVALGWQLAKRFPQAVATIALERQPYADLPEVPGIPAPILQPTDDTEAPEAT